MGTSYSLKFSKVGLMVSKDEVATLVAGELERIEAIFSLYRKDSEISRLNAASADKWIQVSEDLYEVAKFAVDLSQQTDGAFDPTLRSLVELWQGNPLSGSWTPPSQEAIEERLQAVGVLQLEFQENTPAIKKQSSHVQLDLNALVEGWAIDHVLECLKEMGCTSALFELGGEYGAMGLKSDGENWKIGIEDPRARTQNYATLWLNDAALCTSGTYRQAREFAGKRYSHIIDPRTGSPVEHDLLSVSVLHRDPMTADGWATALMVLGPEKGLEFASKFGLAASFVRQSSRSISPTLSQVAEGKIVLSTAKHSTSERTLSLVFGLFLACLSVAMALFVYRFRLAEMLRRILGRATNSSLTARR